MSAKSPGRTVFYFPLSISLVLLTLAGCSRSIVESRAEVVPASGSLTFQEKPVAGAHLTFVHEDETLEPGLALTDKRGRFRCMTNDSSEGIKSGEYVVLVVHPQGGIPARYASVDTSPLRISVADDGGNEFALRLD